MGLKHSKLAPTDGDFAVARQCKASLSPSSTASHHGNGRTFYVTRNVWNHVNGEVLYIPSLDSRLRFVPVVAGVDTNTNTHINKKEKHKKYHKTNDFEDRCLVEDSCGKLLAVLIAQKRRILICTLSPPPKSLVPNASFSRSSTSSSNNMQHPDGRPLHVRGIVKMHYWNGTLTQDYEIVTPEDGAFTTHFFGKSMSSRKNMVLDDENDRLVATLCQVDDDVEEKALTAQVEARRDSTVWKCRTVPGVDEAMIVCLAVCLDKLKVDFKDDYRKKQNLTVNSRWGIR
mmetsp:Transcript_32456/g.79104  ORF Transcript_32456/g.79104 Transcript_32456/m.79104 type:complete len:286 (+) Transcript_32456:371-1228(+)